MSEREQLLDWLGLTTEQKAAARADQGDVLVTAGAGTGKTLTLVGRYLRLLAEGVSARRLLAITFTEKAAREMRNRIRRAVAAWAGEQADPADALRWRARQLELDSARIGTIHSLCAELLRSHPAEAGLDPEFEVLDEAAGAVLKQELVEASLIQASNDAELAGLFESFSIWGLRRLISLLLERRLDLIAWQAEAQDRPPIESVIAGQLVAFAVQLEVSQALSDLRQMAADGSLAADTTETMAAMVAELLAHIEQVETCLAGGDVWGACLHWFRARRQAMRGGVGRRQGAARAAVDVIQQAYDQQLQPWLGGQSSKDPEPDPTIETRLGGQIARIWTLFERTRGAYETILAERGQLDFDGLEQGALVLLRRPEIRHRWQAQIDHVLVDEFQDTNQRQRQIVEALAGAGRLFVVGDARQSIYRFRGADVTVFRQLADDIGARGEALVLDATYRQHGPLLQRLDQLLAPHMPGGSDFEVPYTQLKSKRDQPSASDQEPYVTFVLGIGENAVTGRQVAAELLAAHLVESRDRGRINRWDDVALLFRASSGFSSYEQALANWGVPYLTVAGRGFYERPEIREVLTTLRALAEPWNQAAMAGLLRSALIGMSDVGLFRLRIGPSGWVPFAQAIRSSETALSAEDDAARQRAVRLLEEVGPSVDRLPVAEVLKRLIDWTDARAVLAIAGERQWANLDKLLADARSSRATRVRSFLEYLATLRQAGVREGEAPVAGEGVVQLMTIHKAKGLEFPLVVLADAGYARTASPDPLYLHSDLGLVARPDRWPQDSLVYKVARADDAARELAEEARLLYVAATRAQNHLVISGHLTQPAGSALRTRGWLGTLLEAAELLDEDGRPVVEGAPGSSRFGLVAAAAAPPRRPISDETVVWPDSKLGPLFAPLTSPVVDQADDEFDLPPARDWRATGRTRPPAAVVGLLVHRAIERWLFPPDPALDRLLTSRALGEGLVEAVQRERAIEVSRSLLARLRDHPLAAEIGASAQRRHEIPFAYQTGAGLPDSGAFDLIYRHNGGWRVIDFKTDELRTDEERQAALVRHRPQLSRYQLAAQALLTEPAELVVVFLDDQETVSGFLLTGDGWQRADW